MLAISPPDFFDTESATEPGVTLDVYIDFEEHKARIYPYSRDGDRVNLGKPAHMPMNELQQFLTSNHNVTIPTHISTAINRALSGALYVDSFHESEYEGECETCGGSSTDITAEFVHETDKKTGAIEVTMSWGCYDGWSRQITDATPAITTLWESIKNVPRHDITHMRDAIITIIEQYEANKATQ